MRKAIKKNLLSDENFSIQYNFREAAPTVRYEAEFQRFSPSHRQRVYCDHRADWTW